MRTAGHSEDEAGGLCKASLDYRATQSLNKTKQHPTKNIRLGSECEEGKGGWSQREKQVLAELSHAVLSQSHIEPAFFEAGKGHRRKHG